jgi:hypothetical protein
MNRRRDQVLDLNSSGPLIIGAILVIQLVGMFLIARDNVHLLERMNEFEERVRVIEERDAVRKALPEAT